MVARELLPRPPVWKSVEGPEQHLPLAEVEEVLPLRSVAVAEHPLLCLVVAVVAHQLDTVVVER